VGDEGYNGMLDCFRKIIKNEGYKTYIPSSIADTDIGQFLEALSRHLSAHSHGSSQEVKAAIHSALSLYPDLPQGN
jgi:hypothetical protein